MELLIGLVVLCIGLPIVLTLLYWGAIAIAIAWMILLPNTKIGRKLRG